LGWAWARRTPAACPPLLRPSPPAPPSSAQPALPHCYVATVLPGRGAVAPTHMQVDPKQLGAVRVGSSSSSAAAAQQRGWAQRLQALAGSAAALSSVRTVPLDGSSVGAVLAHEPDAHVRQTVRDGLTAPVCVCACECVCEHAHTCQSMGPSGRSAVGGSRAYGVL